MTKDERDIRGRWKGTGRVSDLHDDVELPYPDAKVAENLFGGGPCFCVSDPTLNATKHIRPESHQSDSLNPLVL